MIRATRNYLNALMYGNMTKKTTKGHMMDKYAYGSSTTNRFLNALQTNQAKSSAANYQNIKDKAGEVQAAANKLTAEGEDSLFAKARETGDTSAIAAQVKEFVEQYNSMVRSLKGAGDKLDKAYADSLNTYAVMHKNVLKATGVTQQTDGTLKLDENTLRNASLEALEKAWGGSNSFAAKAAKTAEYASANAVSNINSMVNNSYSNLLRGYGSSGNYFNIWR